jgi:hypothetical protein
MASDHSKGVPKRVHISQKDLGGLSAAKLKDRGHDDGDDGADFNGALNYLNMQHRSADGTIDPYALGLAIAHRDAMPKEVTSFTTPPQWQQMGPFDYSGTVQNLYNGPGPYCGCIISVAYAQSIPTTVYAGAPEGGVWKSVDSGAHWTPLSDKWAHLAVNSVTVDPTNANNVYVGTGQSWHYYGSFYSLGVMKSTNGGTTWTSTGVPQFGNDTPLKIVVDPTTPSIVTLAVAGADSTQYGIWRSINSGTTWTHVNTAGNMDSLEIGPLDPKTGIRTYWAAGVAAVTTLAGTQLIYKSVDKGATWTAVHTPTAAADYNVSVAVSKISPTTLYALLPYSRAIYKSIDGGTTWTNISAGFPGYTNQSYNNWTQGNYDYYIRTTSVQKTTGPATDGVYVGLITLAFSPDGGTTWTDMAQGFNDGGTLAHVDQHDIQVNPTNPNQMLVGNDGGVFRLDYNPNTATGAFTSLNANLAVGQFYAIAVHPTNAGFVMGGMQDDGTAASRNNYSKWTEIDAGDGAFCAYDSTNGFEYTSSEFFYVTKTVFNTATRTNIAPALYGYTDFIAPLTYSEFANRLFGATSYLYWYSGTGWNHYGPYVDGSHYNDADSTIEVNSGNQNVLYVASDFGSLWYTDHSAASTPVLTRVDQGTTSLPAGIFIASVSSSPLAPHDVLVALGGSGNKHIYHCADVSSASRTWTSVDGTGSTGLPDIAMHSIVRDPYAPATHWYVASDVGVFVTTNAGSTWTNMGTTQGLPNVMTNDLKIDSRNNFLYAGTFGRGMWRIPITGAPALSSVQVVDSILPGGGKTYTGEVTAVGLVPAAGMVVSLASNNVAMLTVPASVTIASGQPWAKFTITAGSPTAATTVAITATVGTLKKTCVVTINPVTAFSLSVPSGYSGTTHTATLTLSGKAPTGGLVYNLTPTELKSCPATVTVPAGAVSASFNYILDDVSAMQYGNIEALRSGVGVSGYFSITPAALIGINPGAPTVKGGNGISITAQLGGTAPTGGATVKLTSSNPALLPLPASIAIPTGSISKAISVVTGKVTVNTKITITAKYGTGATATNFLTITP